MSRLGATLTCPHQSVVSNLAGKLQRTAFHYAKMLQIGSKEPFVGNSRITAQSVWGGQLSWVHARGRACSHVKLIDGAGFFGQNMGVGASLVFNFR